MRDATTAAPFRRSTAFCAWAAIVTGCVVLLGWALDVHALKNLVPGTVSMKAGTAAALASLGASLLLLRTPDPRGRRRAAAAACALFPLALGLAVLGEYVLGWDLGIDELPFRDDLSRAAGSAHPGRFAPTTAASLVLMGLALLQLELRSRRGRRPAEVLAVLVAIVASMSLIGYSYSIPEFYGPAKMAVNTAACFLALAAGVVLSRPHGRLLALVTTTRPGGLMVRALLPFVILMPLLLGWLRLQGTDAGLFGDRVGTASLTAATIAGLILLLWRVAVELNAADGDRHELEARLHELANHDEMTGLLNRRRFEEEMARHAASVRRHGGPTTLMMVDLDGLKEVNDRLGHAAGDTLLKAVAQAIASRLRATDVAGRLGGDEFALLLGNSTREGALRVAEDLRVAIAAARPASLAAQDWSTASIGVAHSMERPADDGHALLAAADAAMYDAKRAGGGRFAYARTGPDVNAPATAALASR